jgi:hypothetical protein
MGNAGRLIMGLFLEAARLLGVDLTSLYAS